MMAPPTRQHQAVLGEIYRQIANFLEGKPWEIYPAPFGVRLYKEKDTVFLPDITVVCDTSKLNSNGCEGAPDFVVEVLSPSTSRYDRFTKFNEYLHAGVLEYWIVDPTDKTVSVHWLKDETYTTEVYSDLDVAWSRVLEGCSVDLSLVFRI
jgi:Uma2 family endonuclease